MNAKKILYFAAAFFVLGFLWHCSADEEGADEDSSLVTNLTRNVEVSAPGLPNTPNNIVVSASNATLLLSWDEVLNAKKYEYRMKNSLEPDRPYVVSDEDASGIIAEPRAELDNLKNDVEYSLQLRTIDVDGAKSPWSRSVVGTPSALSIVTGLNAAEGDGQLELTWDEVEGAAAYELRYRLATAGVDSFLPLQSNADGSEITSTRFVIADLANGREVVVQVRIVDDVGRKGPWFFSARGVPFALAAPTNVALGIGDGQLDLTWDEVVDAASYHVRRKRASEDDATYVETTKESSDSLIKGTNFTVVGLANGRGYTVQVRSVNSRGQPSEWSSPVTGSPYKIPAPENLSIDEEGDRLLRLSWDEVFGAAKYELRYAEGGRTSEILDDDGSPITATNFTIKGLYNLEMYVVSVRAISASGRKGPWSAPAMGTPYVAHVPTNLMAVPNDGVLQLSWTSVVGANKYHVRHKESTQADSEYVVITNDAGSDITAPHYAIDGLANGTNYTVQVRSTTNGDQPSDWSARVVSAPSVALQPPILLLVDDTGTDDSDGITTNSAITITSRPGSTVDLVIRRRGSSTSGEPVVSIPSSGRVNLQVTLVMPNLVPMGGATTVVSVSAEATHDHDGDPGTEAQTASLASPFEFTLAARIVAADVPGITLELDEDTGEGAGADRDLITVNPSVVVGGAVPEGFTLGLKVITNGTAHSHSVSSLGTTDFGISGSSELLAVYVAPIFTRNAQVYESTEGVLTFTYLGTNFDGGITVDYEDNGDDDSDGITTESVLTFYGFDDLLNGSHISVVSYVTTNAAEETSTTNDLRVSGRRSLNGDYKLDMRMVREYLGDDEKIFSIDYSYFGHVGTVVLDPPLRYHADIFFNREFSVASSPQGIAITSNGVLLVTSGGTHRVHFYDTNGSDTNLVVGGSTSNFGGFGSASGQFKDPVDVAVSPEGLIYVVDYTNTRVQIYNADFSYLTNLDYASTTHPRNLLLHGGFVYVSQHSTSFWSSLLRIFTAGSLQSGLFFYGYYGGLAVDLNGIVHLIASQADEIRTLGGSPETSLFRVSSAHLYTTRVGGEAGSSDPYDILVGPTTGWLYLSDRSRNQILVLRYNREASRSPYFLLDIVGHSRAVSERGGTSGSGKGEFDEPWNMLIHDGQLYVVDRNNHRIQVFEVPE